MVSEQDQSLITLRLKVKRWSFKYLLGQVFTNEETGLQASFTRNSIKKTINQPHKEKRLQLLALYTFRQLFKAATLFRKNVPDDKKRGQIAHWIYFKANIDGANLFINVRRDRNGRQIIYSITDSALKKQ